MARGWVGWVLAVGGVFSAFGCLLTTDLDDLSSGTGGSSAGCDDAETTCGAECVDLFTDLQHCGACDAACAVGSACSGGECEVCEEGETACDGGCTTVDNDAENCGACGNACGDGEVCVDGECATGCPNGQTQCGSECVDTSTSQEHCGRCDQACAEDFTCNGGVCVGDCAEALLDARVDTWGTVWDGTERDPANHQLARNTCGQFGARLPTVNEIYRARSAAAGGDGIGEVDSVAPLWSAVPSDSGEHYLLELAFPEPDNIVTELDGNDRLYRCVCPDPAPTFSGGDCAGDSDPFCTTLSSGYVIDGDNRFPLPRAAAIAECAVVNAALPYADQLVAAVSTELTIPQNVWLADVGFDPVYLSGGSASPLEEELNTPYAFRCMAPSIEGASTSAPNPVFGTPQSRFLIETDDRPAGELQAAIEACFDDGGHLATNAEIAEALSLGYDAPSSADTWVGDAGGVWTYPNMTFDVMQSAAAWVDSPVDMSAIDYLRVASADAIDTGPARCIYYRIDRGFNSATLPCNGGCFQLSVGTTDATIWIDSNARPAGDWQDAVVDCANDGGRLASVRDLRESIANGLTGADDVHWTADVVRDRLSNFTTIDFTAIATMVVPSSGPVPDHDIFAGANVHRCVWTNELR